MGYTQVALEEKLFEIYPELRQGDVSMSLRFDEELDEWVIGLSKNGHKLETHLSEADAGLCMDGHVCVPLGVKIGEFMDVFGE